MCNILDHRKIKMIRKGPEGNTLVLLWLLMLAEAGKCNRGGYLMISDSLPYTAETLSMVTDIPLPTVHLGLTTFARLEMIDQQDGVIFITNWRKYQNEDKLQIRREKDRERQQRHRQRERKNILALPAPAQMSRDSNAEMSRDVTPENRTEKRREEKTTTEQIRLLVADTPLSEIPDKGFNILINRHGSERVKQVADIAAEIWRRTRKEIHNPGGYLQTLCESHVVPEWYEPPEERNAKQQTISENKLSEERKKEEKMAAEIRESQERENNWTSLSEEVRQKYRDEANSSSIRELNLSRVVIEAIARTNAWNQRPQMNTNVICSP